MKRAIGALLLAFGVTTLAGARGDAESPADAALRAQVQRAFDRTLRAPGVRSVELRVHRGGLLVSRRAFDLAYRGDAPQARSLLRFTEPSHLRGHALLVLETEAGASDTWLYQPEERRPRRVGAAHKTDAFYGSDLSYEELEHQRFERYALRRLPDTAASHAIVEALPGGDSQYGRLLIFVDAQRDAVARIDFFRGSEREPTKRLTVSLDGVEEDTGFLRVRHMRIEQLGRDSWTEIETRRMAIDPAIAPEVFSTSILERAGDDLYALVLRHARFERPPP